MPDNRKPNESYTSLWEYFIKNSPLFVVMGVFGVLSVNINLIVSNNKIYKLPNNSTGYLAHIGMATYNDLFTLIGTVAALVIFLIISGVALWEFTKLYRNEDEDESNVVSEAKSLIKFFINCCFALMFLVLIAIVLIIVYLRFDATLWYEIIKIFGSLFLSLILLIVPLSFYSRLKKVRYIALAASILFVELYLLNNYLQVIINFYLYDINYPLSSDTIFRYLLIVWFAGLVVSIFILYMSGDYDILKKSD